MKPENSAFRAQPRGEGVNSGLLFIFPPSCSSPQVCRHNGGQTQHPDHRVGAPGQEEVHVFGAGMTMMIRVSVTLHLIRIKLQVQKGRSLYHGTFDASSRSYRADGALASTVPGQHLYLYLGQCYVTTYELTRKFVADTARAHRQVAVKLVARPLSCPEHHGAH